MRLYACVINGKRKPNQGQKKNQKPKANKQTNKQTQVNQAQGSGTNEPEDARAAACVLQQARECGTQKHNAREKTEGSGTEP